MSVHVGPISHDPTSTTRSAVEPRAGRGLTSFYLRALIPVIAVSGIGCQDVAVTAVAVLNVEVEPENASIVLGQNQKLSAILRDGAGNQLTDRTVTWSSERGDVAEVDSTGMVSAKGIGKTRITASAEGRTGEATIDVLPKPVGSVVIDPGELTLREGAEDTVRVVVQAEDGTELTDREVSWSSNNEGIVEVNGIGPNGLEARVRAGGCPRGEARCTAEIIGSAEGATDAATVTVRKTPAQIEISADRTPPYLMLPGATIQLAANVEASDGTDLTAEVSVSWASSDEAVAKVDETGKVTAVGCPQPVLLCSAMISVSVDDAEGVSDELEVEVLKIATAVSISPAVVSDTLDPSETVSLTAKPTADDGKTELSETRPITWTSSAATTAQVSPQKGVMTIVTANDPACPVGEPVCTAGITAEVDGVSDQVDVHVRKAIATVRVIPSSVIVPLLFPHEQPFTATPLAEDSTPLPDRLITWSLKGPGNQGSPCGQGRGPARVTLSPTGGASTTATVPPSFVRSFVLIWAESEGVVGCATLQIGS